MTTYNQVSVPPRCWVMFPAGKEETSWWSLHRMVSTTRRRFSWIGVTSPAAMSVVDWGKTKTMWFFVYTTLSHSGLTTLVRRTVELTWGLRLVWSWYLWLNVSFFSEVGLLSRNVVIRGEMESSCYPPNPCEELDYDTFGGHIIAKYVCIEWYQLQWWKTEKFRKDFSTFRVEHAELRQMGQLGIIGRYDGVC